MASRRIPRLRVVNSGEDWVARVRSIRAWSRSGVRAPHKPLLLLYVLGRLQRDRTNAAISFKEAERPLRELLEEYGPPNPTSPGYPFHHLTNDGLWVVSTVGGKGSPGPNLGTLRSQGASGQLDPSFAKALITDPSLLTRVARCLLDANFPPSLHDDIAAAVGLDLDLTTDGEVTDLVARRHRNPAFRTDVLLAYEARCAMCGWDGRLGGDGVGVEAAHIRWFNIEGPDTLENGLCLCTIHHKLLDTGAIGISPERTVAVSLRFVGRSRVVQQLVYELIGRALEPPQSGLAGPADDHIAWHTAQVFRPPARQSV
jgi:putative restriction endonuclease